MLKFYYKLYIMVAYSNPFSVLENNNGDLADLDTKTRNFATGSYQILWQIGIICFILSFVLIAIDIAWSRGKKSNENKSKLGIVIGCLIIFSSVITIIGWANDVGSKILR